MLLVLRGVAEGDPFDAVGKYRSIAAGNTLLLFSFYWCYSQPMEITVKLPDDLAQHPDPGREALEALVIEGYRSGALSHYQASQLLGISRLEFDGFLKQRNIYEHAYDLADLEQDRETLRQLHSKGLFRR